MATEELDCLVGSDQRCAADHPGPDGVDLSSEIGGCASQGCRPALDRVLESCDAVVGPAVRWLDDPADIDEAIQRTRIQVHRNITGFRQGSLRAWVRQIGVNEARQINRQRHGASRPLPGLPSDAMLDDRGLFKISTELTTRELWRWAVARLPEDNAVAYLLRERSGLTYEEIAEQQRIPVNTAKTRVRRARRRLAELLGDVDPDRNRAR